MINQQEWGNFLLHKHSKNTLAVTPIKEDRMWEQLYQSPPVMCGWLQFHFLLTDAEDSKNSQEVEDCQRLHSFPDKGTFEVTFWT